MALHKILHKTPKTKNPGKPGIELRDRKRDGRLFCNRVFYFVDGCTSTEDNSASIICFLRHKDAGLKRRFQLKE